MEKLEVLFASHAIAAGYNDGGVFDVDLALLDMAVYDFDYKVGVADIFFGSRFTTSPL